MSYEPPEILSQEQIRQRIGEVIAQHPDGRDILHKPETRLLLRVSDIADYLNCEAPVLYRFSRGETQRISVDLQRRLSWFYHAWDRRRLVKEMVDTASKRGPGAVRGRGVLVCRKATATPQPPPPPAQPMRIELTPQGPRLRLPGRGTNG